MRLLPGGRREMLALAMAARTTFTRDPRLDMKGYFVHVDGGLPVGPVSADQIARGIRAGKIPAEASIQWQGDVFWRGLYEDPGVLQALNALD